MSIECAECERDARGGHDPSCSRYDGERCPDCANRVGYEPHELWCDRSPKTLTMGELRELLTKAIELDGVHESKRVAFAYRTPHHNGGQEIRLTPLSAAGVQFLRGEFVFVLEQSQ